MLTIWPSFFLARHHCGLSGEPILQESLNSLNLWSLQNGLTFSPSKSVGVHFYRIRSCSHSLELKIGTDILPHASSANYLGMILDEKLTWRPHIQRLKQSCMQKLNIIRKLANTSYGSDTSTLVSIYKTLIQSKLDYGATAYSSAKTSTLDSLNTIQHTALRLASGAFRTTPSISILADIGEIPISYRRQRLLAAYFVRLKARPYLPLALNQLQYTRGCTLPESFEYQIHSLFNDLKLSMPKSVMNQI